MVEAVALTDREIDVLKLRFGYTDGRYRTLEEVGRLLFRKDGTGIGVTRERVRQIEAIALRKILGPDWKIERVSSNEIKRVLAEYDV